MLESGKLAIFTDDVSTAPEPTWVSLTCAILHLAVTLSKCLGCRMATRCADTSGEHGYCHMTCRRRRERGMMGAVEAFILKVFLYIALAPSD